MQTVRSAFQLLQSTVMVASVDITTAEWKMMAILTFTSMILFLLTTWHKKKTKTTIFGSTVSVFLIALKVALTLLTAHLKIKLIYQTAVSLKSMLLIRTLTSAFQILMISIQLIWLLGTSLLTLTKTVVVVHSCLMSIPRDGLS